VVGAVARRLVADDVGMADVPLDLARVDLVAAEGELELAAHRPADVHACGAVDLHAGQGRIVRVIDPEGDARPDASGLAGRGEATGPLDEPLALARLRVVSSIAPLLQLPRFSRRRPRGEPWPCSPSARPSCPIGQGP